MPQSSIKGSSLARQRPQQAAGGGEEVDGGGAICDEGGLEPQSLKHLHLQDKSQPISRRVPS